MKLQRFKYWEREKSGEEWEVEPLTFGDFNLVVGRNATGKTRLLRAIARVAAELSEAKAVPRTMKFEVEVSPQGADAKIEWSKQAQYFPFAGGMNLRLWQGGREVFYNAAQAFQLGVDRIGSSFHEHVEQRMIVTGYPWEEIRVVNVANAAPRLEVKEHRRSAYTAFRRLSQAQQRTLAFYIFVSLLEEEKTAATVLVDDFAEGLDYESAGRFAKVVLQMSSTTPLQFIVATNDRYVMNAVPLEHWTVLVEDGTTTRIFNYENARQKFDDFKFTGLSNFDFFSMDFARESK